tara:strand:+ start:3604 stop:6903 length:3300 start_codon:yes stop_codon:yes gene_type:complete
MGSDKSADRYQGILIPDARFKASSLLPTGLVVEPMSAYTQAGPSAGVPGPADQSDMVLKASGDQSAGGHLEILTQLSGHPGVEQAQYIWRDANVDSSKGYKGWDPYSVITGWETLQYTASASTAIRPDIIRLESNKLLAVGSEFLDTGVLKHRIYTYDPTTSLWTTDELALDPAVTQAGPALLQLPGGSVLLFLRTGPNKKQIQVMRSSDDGATWEVYSDMALRTRNEGEALHITAAYSNGEVGLWIQFVDGSSNKTMAQYASDDLGMSFTQVVANWQSDVTAESVRTVRVVPGDAGGFVLGYTDDGGSVLRTAIRRLGSAFLVPSGAGDVLFTAQIAFASVSTALAMWRDEDGPIYLMTTTDDGASPTPVRRYNTIFWSQDDGESWEVINDNAGIGHDPAGASQLTDYAVESIGGRAVMMSRWESESTELDNGSEAVIHLGSFGAHTMPFSDVNGTWRMNDTVAFAASTGGGEGKVYLPVDEPDDVGWTKAGTGAVSLGLRTRAGALVPTTAGGLKIDSTSASVLFDKEAPASTDQIVATFAVEIDDTEGSKVADDITFTVIVADGSSARYIARYRLAHDGWQLYDVLGATSITPAVSEDLTLTSSLMYHRISVDIRGNLRTWYARAGHVLEWVEGPEANLAGDATVDNSEVEWGHMSANADHSAWHLVGFCGWGRYWSPATSDQASLGDSWDNPANLKGRGYPTVERKALIKDNVKIEAADGPSVRAESWDIETDYTHRIDNAISDPSPRVAWRSTNETEHTIAFDLDGLTSSKMHNTSVGLVLLGINFQTCDLDRWDGAAWQTVGTLDAAEDFSPATSLQGTRDGKEIRPSSSGGFTAGRYIHYGDLVGGTVNWTAGEGTFHKIESNTEGAWTDSAAKHPTIRVEDVDDGADPGSGNLKIWLPNVALLVHEYDEEPRYMRLRIPAQTTADGYFEIGQILAGPLLVFGHQYSRGITTINRQNVELASWVDGTTRATRKGPAAREVTFSWDDGVDATGTQAADALPDYVAGSTSGLAIASRSDVVRTLEGAMSTAAGQENPVVFFSRIPTGTGSLVINNPRQFVYGRVSSDSRREHITGDEQASEVDRMATVTITEIV